MNARNAAGSGSDGHVHLHVAGDTRAPWDRARWGVALLALGGAALFGLSLSQAWWRFWLYAPQYPSGLKLTIALTGMGGDVHEIDLLNHYIGMAHLETAAPVERRLAGYGVAAIAILTIALVLAAGKRLNALVAVPAFLFPAAFLGDSFYWLYSFGHHLDPRAPLKMSAFTPQMFGNGKIGQFETFAQPDVGFWLAVAGVAFVLGAAILRTLVCRSCARAGACGARCPRFLVFGASLLAVACLASPASADTTTASPRDFEELARLVADVRGPSVIELRATTYRGDLAVKRSVVIRGAPGAVLEGSGASTVVTIDAHDVTLEDVAVRHSGRRNTTEDAGIKATGDRIAIRGVRVDDALFGVSLAACHACLLERVRVEGLGDAHELRGDGIKLWEAHDSVVRGCVVRNARDVVVWYTRRALVEGNVVEDGRYGTHFMYAHDAIARGNRYERDVVGVFVMYSARIAIESNVIAGARGAAGMGLGFKESDAATVRGNWIVASTTGVYLDFTPRTPSEPVTFEKNVLALDDVAVRLHSVERGVAFRANDFRENGRTIDVDGGGDALACDVRGNHFSDYEGYDLDGDGVGDVPYRVTALESDLADAHPAIRFFHGTPAMGLALAIARAVPVLDARELLVDTAPLVRAPEVTAP
jgi:nitrous oxidase accessory protein